MSNEITTAQQASIDVFDELTQNNTGPGWLKLIQGMSKEAGYVKPGMFCLATSDLKFCVPVGHYQGQPPNRICGFNSLYLGWRAKAICLHNNKLHAQSFLPDSATWKAIKNTRKTESVLPFLGTETLHYIPEDQFNLDAIDVEARGLKPHEVGGLKKSVEGGSIVSFYWSAPSAKPNTIAGPPERARCVPGQFVRLVAEPGKKDKGNYTIPKLDDILDTPEELKTFLEDNQAIIEAFVNAGESERDDAPVEGEVIDR